MSGFWLVMLASAGTVLGAVANVLHYLAAKNKNALEEKIAGYMDDVKKLVDAQTAPKA